MYIKTNCHKLQDICKFFLAFCVCFTMELLPYWRYFCA